MLITKQHPYAGRQLAPATNAGTDANATWYIVSKQFVELKRTLCGQGNYVLSDTAKKLVVDHRQWAGMSKEEHIAAFRRLLRFKGRDTRKATSTDERLTVPVVPNAGKKVGQQKERRQELTNSKK